MAFLSRNLKNTVNCVSLLTKIWTTDSRHPDLSVFSLSWPRSVELSWRMPFHPQLGTGRLGAFRWKRCLNTSSPSWTSTVWDWPSAPQRSQSSSSNWMSRGWVTADGLVFSESVEAMSPPDSGSWSDDVRNEYVMMALMINSAIFMYNVPIREQVLLLFCLTAISDTDFQRSEVSEMDSSGFS